MLLCLSCFAHEYITAFEAVGAAGAGRIDLVELRIDGADFQTVESAAAACRKPLIFACRSAADGGRFAGSEAERVRLLSAVLRFRPLYVDVELGSGAQDLITRFPEQPFILSHHDPTGTPSDLQKLAASMARLRPAVLKLVTRARQWPDNLVMLDLARSLGAGRRHPNFVCFCSGPMGLVSRVLAPAHGSAFTFVTAPGLTPTAEGQPTAREASGLYRLRSIRPSWPVLGIAGDPVAHSLSPALHNRLLARYGVDAVYLPFRVEDFESFVDFAPRLPLAGLSVTAPHKAAAALHSEPAEQIVRTAWAANTLVMDAEAGCYRSYNTDGPALAEALAVELGSLEGRRVTIIGAGGAGRAAAFSLAGAGARLVICCRGTSDGRDFAAAIGARFSCDPADSIKADAVINTTTVAAAGQDSHGLIRRLVPLGALAADLHYSPPEPFFLAEAALRGCRTMNGLSMFALQAARQFRLFTGIEPEKRVVEEALTDLVDQGIS